MTTADEVKKLYKKLATKYHPDKPGGDLRTMQEINADYDRAMKIAISGEGNEARAKAETSAIKPLREAIEFARFHREPHPEPIHRRRIVTLTARRRVQQAQHTPIFACQLRQVGRLPRALARLHAGCLEQATQQCRPFAQRLARVADEITMLLPFGTYRHHLRTAQDALAQVLWMKLRESA